MSSEINDYRIAVVIPSYKVIDHILGVISAIPQFVCRIYVVDDACPNESGKFVLQHSTDSRIKVIFHEKNQGVGGAVISGYLASIEENVDIVVKIDGDGQMDPALIPFFIEPIITGEADYTKGNRFYDLEKIREMPPIRIFGNAVLSFMTKLSSGYWNLFDPTNGYTAIHIDACKLIPFSKVSNRYFFETDMLFRLNILRAVVTDVPMDAKYGDEQSNLKISKIAGEFFTKHMRNLFKRIFYNYFLRDLSLASIELVTGTSMVIFGLFFGGYSWIESANNHVATPAGTVMLAAMPILVGIQLILSFIGYDIASMPRKILHRKKASIFTLSKKS